MTTDTTPGTPRNGSSALLRALNAIEDRGGIHDRFMPDLVLDIRSELQVRGFDILAIEAASPATGEGLDVERLARALAITEVGCWANPARHPAADDDAHHLADARHIAAEYARLAATTLDPGEAE